MRHRVFVGLPISRELQHEIGNWAQQFANLPVRWLQGKNLHITLVPPWYVEAQARTGFEAEQARYGVGADSTQTNADLNEVKKILQKVAGFSAGGGSAFGGGAFEISFSRVTFGPDLRRPRLIWAEGETPKELLELQQKLCEGLNREPEKRPFRLHLTIARFRPEDFSSFPIKTLDEKVDWRDKVDRVVLFESKLSRSGADYEIITEISL